MSRQRIGGASRSRTRALRVVRVVALAGALALLAVGALSSLQTARGRAADDLDRRLSATAREERANLDDYFTRARDINLLVAQNPAFRGFDQQPGPRDEKIRAGGPNLTAANAALVYLERLYPGQIGEACFIDAGGAENARVVRGRRARVHELAPDESGRPFFRPTFALASGQVYQAKPYVSPDTGEWVISNATPVPSADGRTRSIVHFEITLESFRRRITQSGLLVRITDGAGTVILDSRHAQVASRIPGNPDDRSLAGLLTGGGASGITRAGDDRVAYARVAVTPGNANRWFVTVSAPAATVSSLSHVGWDASILVLLGLVLLAVAIWGFRAYQHELRGAALTDPLSRLPNRNLFYDRAGQALAAGRRDGLSTAVVLLDLDRFKDINDTLGHLAGDTVLKEAADRLAGGIRERDTVARLGGDEFAVVFPQLDGRDAAIVATRRIVACLEPAFTVGGVPLGVNASFGVAIAPDHGDDVNTLIKRADIAMYDAKRSGHGIGVYSPDLDVSDPDGLTMVGELRVAIDDGRLELEYQPKVDLATGRMDGVEALVRWDHPRLGRLAATEFIGLAEDTGVVRQLTAKVIELGVAQCRAWLDQGIAIQVAINLSVRCVQDPAIVTLAEEALTRYDVPPGLLKLEVTEKSLARDDPRVRDVLDRLADAGIMLSIDGYGTGHSSLVFLKELPVHELKIDRILTKRLGEAGIDTDIVRSTVDLGHSLGLRVVATGVETGTSAHELMRLGCDTAQGHYFSRPLSAAALTEWIHGSRPLVGGEKSTTGG